MCHFHDPGRTARSAFDAPERAERPSRCQVPHSPPADAVVQPEIGPQTVDAGLEGETSRRAGT